MNSFALTLNPGEKWSARIGRNKSICFTSQGAGANLALLLYHATDPGERLNLPDTLKSQHTAKLSAGNVLYSEMGRILASITEDTLGWHDPIGGLIHRDQVDARYGITRFQEERNERLASGYENILTEIGKYGLGKRDIVPNVNLFSRVWASPDGAIHWDPEHCKSGASVSLRTEMDVILVVSNTPHPLDARTNYPSVPIQIKIAKTEGASQGDRCRNLCPQNQRGFENTELYHFLAE